jgi:hypothetical protein
VRSQRRSRAYGSSTMEPWRNRRPRSHTCGCAGKSATAWPYRLALRPKSHQVPRHSGLRNVKAELQQFPVDARRTPTRVLALHSSDQRTDFNSQRRPARCSAGLPLPEKAKARTMPGHSGLRLHHYQKVRPARVDSPQECPEEAVSGCEFRARLLALEDDQLLSQGSAFQCEPVPR